MANLKINIGAATSALGRGLALAKGKLSEFAGSVKSVMSSKVGLLLTGGGVAGAAAAFSGFVEKLDGIGKAAKRIGISAEEFQKLTFAARRSGASTEDVETSMKKMSKTIFNAQSGMKSSIDALEKLGVKMDDLAGKSPEQQFAILADALSQVQDATTKAALAQEIFGRSGTNILPMIADYKALGDELERIGGIIDNETIEAAESFQDQMENLKMRGAATAGRSGVVEGADYVLKQADKGLNDFENPIGKAMMVLGRTLLAPFSDTLPLEDVWNPISQEEMDKFRAGKAARTGAADKAAGTAAGASSAAPYFGATAADSLRAIGANAPGAGMTVESKLDRQTSLLESIDKALSTPYVNERYLMRQAHQRITTTTDGAKA